MIDGKFLEMVLCKNDWSYTEREWVFDKVIKNKNSSKDMK